MRKWMKVVACALMTGVMAGCGIDALMGPGTEPVDESNSGADHNNTSGMDHNNSTGADHNV